MRTGPVLISILTGAVFVSATALMLSNGRNAALPQPAASVGLQDQDILLYMEAIANLQKHAVFLPPRTRRETIVTDSLKAYLPRIDPSSDYLTRDEYRHFKDSQDDRYVGVGMEIRREKDGRITCFPYPNGPAARAGILAGDEIESINGSAVDGKSVMSVAAIARGKPGTDIQFVIRTRTGVERPVSIKRSAVELDSVSTDRVGDLRVVKISFFSRDTKDKLEQVVNGWKSGQALVLDLRSDAGGDLHAAVDAAMLFLAKGKKIASIETRAGEKAFEASGRAVKEIVPIYVWQDAATASAAEVFSAALIDNNRAVSIGQRTYGKGTVQEVIELSDGSAMILTTGLLKTPRGIRFDGHGLPPTFAVASDSQFYVRKVEELSRAKRSMDSGKRESTARTPGDS